MSGFIITVLMLILCGQSVSAHEIRPAIFTLQIKEDRSINLSASLNLEALLADIGGQHDDTDDSPNAKLYEQLRRLSPSELESRLKSFATEWISNLSLTFDGKPADLKLSNTAITEVGDTDLARISDVTLEGSLPSSAKNLRWAYKPSYGSSVLRIERPGQEVESQWYSVGDKSGDIAIAGAQPKSKWQVFVDYVVIGFTHILPKGLDHILFVVGLFLLSQHWKPLLTQVTAFTIAHSVTLALGLYGVVTISPSIVEPLIALSIVYVAVENILTNKLHAWRPVIVFLFGLLHGLGFAGVLKEIGLAEGDFVLGLIAFNVGVELGQLAVIVLCFAAVAWFMKQNWYRSRIIIPASFAIAAMGAWWFVERTIL